MIEGRGLQGALSHLEHDFKEAGRAPYVQRKSQYSLEDTQPILLREDQLLIFPLQTGECAYYWIDFSTDYRYNQVVMYVNRGARPFDYKHVTHSWVITPEDWTSRCQKS